MKFRIFRSQMPISSIYDNTEWGDYKVRQGRIYDIEFWLHKFSVSFSFVIWSSINE